MNAENETTREPTAGEAIALERYINNAADRILDKLDPVVKDVVGDAYEEGFDAGVLQGRHEVEQEYETDGPVAELVGIVKAAQVRLLGAPYGGTQTLVYDNLIFFLESGELPPEWQP